LEAKRSGLRGRCSHVLTVSSAARYIAETRTKEIKRKQKKVDARDGNDDNDDQTLSPLAVYARDDDDDDDNDDQTISPLAVDAQQQDEYGRRPSENASGTNESSNERTLNRIANAQPNGP